MTSLQIIVICGPTAVGKTKLGIELCRRFGGEIVSADSQQVYRGMDIGTAKDDLTGSDIPCHLLDVADPDQAFDASRYKELADQAITEIVEREKLPVVVGGTGFYIKVLLEGLCKAPGRDEDIRAELSKIKEEQGREALYNILQAEDPATAKKLHPNDFTRIIRAIEVKRLTGKSLAELHVVAALRGGPKQYQPMKIGLNMDRELLYERINNRVDQMMEKGLVAEVEGLVSKYGPEIQSLKAVGYKEIVSYLKKEISLEDAVRLTKQNTRRLAKRQLTWFKTDPEIKWYSPQDFGYITKIVEKFINKS